MDKQTSTVVTDFPQAKSPVKEQSSPQKSEKAEDFDIKGVS